MAIMAASPAGSQRVPASGCECTHKCPAAVQPAQVVAHQQMQVMSV
jgi:hypothetical protein